MMKTENKFLSLFSTCQQEINASSIKFLYQLNLVWAPSFNLAA